MVKLNEDYIFRIKSACNISSVVSNYVELKYSGKNKKCCCPFHSEKTPSFFVFEDTESFYCFGCGVGGDVITFIEKIENLDYVEAVRFLANFAGIEFPSDDGDGNGGMRLKILEINKQAARFFFNNLKTKQGTQCLEYIFKKRKLNKNSILKFGIGFATSGWNDLGDYLRKKGFSNEEIKSCDLIVKSRNGKFYDKFRNRVIFPIIDLKGDVVAFGGRTIFDDCLPKYLNSADTLVFKKSLGLYGLNFAKNSKLSNLLVCEGYLDVISLHQNGVDCAVATLGTALTKEQVRLISRNHKDVVLAYDMDQAGKNAIKRAFLLFEEVGISCKILKFSGAKDPDEFVNKFGVRKLLNAISNAQTMEKIQFQNILKKYDLNDFEQKRQYVIEYCNIVAQMKNPIKKEIYIGDICSKLKLDRYVVSKHIKLIYDKKFKKFEDRVNRNYDVKIKLSKNKNNIPLKVIKAEEGVLRYLYFNPDMLELIKKKIRKNWFNVEWHKKLFSFLVEHIDLKKNLDFSIFHEVLNHEEMSVFSKILNSKEMYKNVLEEFEDYIKILESFYEDRKQNVLSLTLEELEKKRKEKAELKY